MRQGGNVPGQKVLPLFWLARLVRGFEDEDFNDLSDEEQKEFLEELTEEDLEDPDPWPVLINTSGGERVLCFFSEREDVLDLIDRFFTKVNQVHHITGEPITKDNVHPEASGDVEKLLALCDKAADEQVATRGIINPPPEFFKPYSTYLAPTLAEVKAQIQRKAKECAW